MENVHIALMTGEAQSNQLSPIAFSSDVVVTGWFNKPLDFIDHINEIGFDVVVVDDNDDLQVTLTLINTVAKDLPYTKIIVVCKNPDNARVHTFIKHGVKGIITRGDLGAGFRYFARSVNDGRLVISPSFFKSLLGSS